MHRILDFILRLNVEARVGLGEDSWCHAFGERAGLIAAFDGCGGSGARKHALYSGHSEAFMASRLCAGAFFDGFRDSVTGDVPAEATAILRRCAQYCRDSFSAYRPAAGSASRLKSSMITTLPTTAAAALILPEDGALSVTVAWAGDSRVYALTPQGLMQLSLDDSEDPDPFETDAMMTNTLNADQTPHIHKKTLRLPLPAFLLAATDGCFAYYTTPMEFEGALLSTLADAATPNEWEQALAAQIGRVAGDDYTMVLASFGFSDFAQLRQAFAARYDLLRTQFLVPLSLLPPNDTAARRALWMQYRSEYMKYIKEAE